MNKLFQCVVSIFIVTATICVMIPFAANAKLFAETYEQTAAGLTRQFEQITSKHRLDSQAASTADRYAAAWFFLYRCEGKPTEIPRVDSLDLVSMALSGDVGNEFVAAFLEMVGLLTVETEGKSSPSSPFCRFAHETAVK
jgi:hypothetical protein